jgi:arylsulfatase
LRAAAVYDLLWDPGEQYDMAFNGAAPTHGNQTSPGRYSGSDNGWVGMYAMPRMVQFFEELKTHPDVPYKPAGEGMREIIPPEYR